MISVSEEDLARLLQERIALAKQVTELQTAGTLLIQEMRRLAKHEIELPFRFFTEDGLAPLPAPKYHTDGSVCMDLQTRKGVLLQAHGRAKLPTGIGIQLPPGYAAKVFPRSGISDRDGLVAIDGSIDWDYRGEMSIQVHNIDDKAQKISVGDRIAQLMILPVMRARLVEVKALDVTVRGDKGFGSTGT